MADVSKLNGYAITGSGDSAATVTKLSGYAIKDGYLLVETTSKLLGYAIYGSSDSATTVCKLSAYAVIDNAGASVAKRPQVFICT